MNVFILCGIMHLFMQCVCLCRCWGSCCCCWLHFQSAINWLASKGILSDYIEAMTVSKQLQAEQWDAHCSCKWSFIANSFATIINICEELEAAAAAVSAILDMNHVKIIVRRASRWRIFYWLDVLATTTSLRRLVLFYEFSFLFPFPVVCIKNYLVFHLSRSLSLSVQIENIHSTPTTHGKCIGLWMCCQSFALSRNCGRELRNTLFYFYQMSLRFTNSFAIVHTFYYFHFDGWFG